MAGKSQKYLPPTQAEKHETRLRPVEQVESVPLAVVTAGLKRALRETDALDVPQVTRDLITAYLSVYVAKLAADLDRLPKFNRDQFLRDCGL